MSVCLEVKIHSVRLSEYRVREQRVLQQNYGPGAPHSLHPKLHVYLNLSTLCVCNFTLYSCCRLDSDSTAVSKSGSHPGLAHCSLILMRTELPGQRGLGCITAGPHARCELKKNFLHLYLSVK